MGEKLFRQQQHTTTTHNNNTQQHTTTHNNTQQHTTTHNNTQQQQDTPRHTKTASGSTPLQQPNFEGFGKRLGNLVSFPCAHDGSTPQQAPSFDVSQGCLRNPVSICGSTPHGSSILTSTVTRRLNATASLRSKTSLFKGIATESRCVTGWHRFSTGSVGQSASEFDIPSCFESAGLVGSLSRSGSLLSGLLLGCLLLIKVGSKSVEVQRVWEVYDDRLQLMSRQDALLMDESLNAGDVSQAWLVWSSC